MAAGKAFGSQPVAVIEVVVRAQLGQKCCGGRPVAVTEALEVVVGARLGQKRCDSLAVAVIEPLEVDVRARLGQNYCTAWWLP